MARYIDADALLSRLPDDLPYKGSVKRVLIQAPTADVAGVGLCKDCYLYGHCRYGVHICKNENGEYIQFPASNDDGKVCEGFKDKSRIVELPCKVGTHLWKVTYPYRAEPKVTEFVVKNFKTAGKKHCIQIEVQAVNVPCTNWMYFKDFYESREEAEEALRKERGNDR